MENEYVQIGDRGDRGTTKLVAGLPVRASGRSQTSKAEGCVASEGGNGA